MNLFKIYIILYITLILNAQQPCTSFLNDELGCISNVGEQCSWNQFTSSCQSSTSVNIGCNLTLNYDACIAQLIYPNEEWAYCRFSGYCRAVTENLNTCDINLSSPACLAATTEKCKWESNQCKAVEATEATLFQSASSYTDDLKYASVLVCQGVTNFEVVHSWSARTSLQTLFSSTLSSNAALAMQYKAQLNTPGCLVPDSSLLNLLTCDALGLNRLACMKITTSGQKCIFLNNKCQTLTNPSVLSCSDSINKESCLSVTNINQPCYWQNSQCKFMQLTSAIACNTFTINNVAVQVSPSFCSSNISFESGTILAECFYNEKKMRCHSMCRAKSAKADSKTCRQSSFGCEFKNSTCVFKNLPSQCGLLGQNKAACMNASENCQFKDGFCISISNLNSVGCSDGLNLKACISVTKKGQQCRFQKGVCEYYKSTYYEGCTDLTQVNSNVCQRFSGSECYWNNGSCYSDTNKACTQVGLNRQGCLYSSNTVSPCQWIAASGSCQNLTVLVNVTKCDLKLINDLACRQIQIRDQIENKDIMCQYVDSTNSCQVVSDISTVTCGTTGLNRAGCVSIQSSDIACRWTQGQCVQVITSLSNVSCSSLSGVTKRTCSLVTSNEEMCTYSSSGNRCTTSVQKNFGECNMPGVNGYGCSFLDNGKSCYFNDDNKLCTEITVSNEGLFQTLQCTSGQMNKKACLLIQTPGQRCYWNDMKKQCQSYSYPTYESCEWINNAGINTCIGYENDVQGYIDEESRCTVSATDVTQCALYTSTDILTNCGGDGIKLNIHACVALSNENDYCYFNISTYVCTQANLTDLPKIVSTIQCKQAGKKICTNIQTPDQACAWDDDQKKCYYQDLCKEAADENACLAVNQPCVFKDSACTIISSSSSQTYNCTDASIKFNRLGCLTILGGTCKFTGNVCSQVSVSATDTCDTYNGNETTKYNPLTCASITKSSSQCVFDRPSGGCQQQVAYTDQCANGQNKINCLSENGCQFNDETKLCTALPYDCGTATTLVACRSKQNPCMWVNADNKCKPSPYFENCTDYSTIGIQYNDFTCNSQSVSDPDNFICGSVVNAVNDYQCQEVANKKCKGTDIEACRYIKNICIFTSNTCKQTSVTYKKCSDIFTKYACLSISSLYCQWDDTSYCTDWDEETGDCGTVDSPVDANVSIQICYYMGCYFDINDLTCKLDDSIPINCEASKGPAACAKVTKNCYWDNDNKCKELLDLTKAESFTFNQVYYSNKLICLSPKSEGVLTIYDSGQCQSPNINSIICTNDVNIRACEAIATQGQKCIYKNNQCQVANPNTLNCTDSLNIHGCVSVSTFGQYCVWLGQQCANLIDDGYTMTKYDIVNQNACLKTYTINGQRNNALAEIGVKFNESVQTCVTSDPERDLCTTPGLNYYGCLQTKADICTWNGTSCIKFTQTGTYLQCSDYTNVSAKVCESITIVGAKCYYFNYGCANATKTMKCTQSLNKEACIMQEQYSCKWVDGSCQDQDVLPAITACSGNIHQLAQYSSPYSCQLVSFGLQACLFDKEGCTQKFDPLIHGCSTLGLNKDGCTQVILEKCIFQNNKCQQYTGSETICRNLVNVNALVCASLDLVDQPCKYSRISKGCVEAVINDTCEQQGINAAGCKLLTKCTWNYDNLQCQCASFMDGRSFCKKMNQQQCLSDDRCLWEDINNNGCRIKQCEDQDILQCNGWIINNSQCYVQTNNNVCVSAKTCNDVRGIQDCTTITIFQQQCYQHSPLQCQIKTCEVIIKENDCSGLCQWNGSSCDYKQCEYFTLPQNCQGTYYNQSCQWINGKCVGFTSCQQYNNYDTDETINQSLCAQAKVFGAQCRWQQDAPFSSTYNCSSNPCRPLGSSKVNCEGAETEDSVCVLNGDFTCVSCESITDGCECSSYIGNCKYVNGSCISVSCSSLSKSSCNLFESKCMWYEADQKCFVQCVKLKQKECENMQQYLLCYWDNKLEQCNTGVSTVVQIDTVAPILLPQTQNTSDLIVQLIYLILFIQI